MFTFSTIQHQYINGVKSRLAGKMRVLRVNPTWRRWRWSVRGFGRGPYFRPTDVRGDRYTLSPFPPRITRGIMPTDWLIWVKRSRKPKHDIARSLVRSLSSSLKEIPTSSKDVRSLVLSCPRGVRADSSHANNPARPSFLSFLSLSLYLSFSQ